MTTTVDQRTRVHPIARFAERAREVIGTLADAPAWSMTPDEQRLALCDLVALEAQVAELKGRVLVAADRNDVAQVDASPSTVAWLRGRPGPRAARPRRTWSWPGRSTSSTR